MKQVCVCVCFTKSRVSMARDTAKLRWARQESTHYTAIRASTRLTRVPSNPPCSRCITLRVLDVSRREHSCEGKNDQFRSYHSRQKLWIGVSSGSSERYLAVSPTRMARRFLYNSRLLLLSLLTLIMPCPTTGSVASAGILHAAELLAVPLPGKVI